MATIIWSGSGFASLGVNWVGGVAPISTDIAAFPTAGSGACTWDIALIAEINVSTLYDNTIFQTVDVHVTSDFTFVGNLASLWNTNTNDLNIDGNSNVTGVGDGVVHSSGGTIRYGGNIFSSNVPVGTERLTSDTVFHHSLATPTLPRTHTIDISNNASRLTDITIVDNQAIFSPSARWVTDRITFGVGTSVTTTGQDIIVNGVWVTPNNCVFDSGSIAGAGLSFNNLVPTAFDGGNFDFAFQNQPTQTLTGDWVTLGDAFITISASGAVTAIATLTDGSSLLSRNLQIGNATEPERCSTFIQEPNTSVQTTGDVLVVQDDTFETNQWSRKAGVLDTVIGGSFTVEADAGLDCTDDTSKITIGGNCSVNANATANYGLTTLVFNGSGAQVVNLKSNPHNIREEKTGGSITYTDAWVATGEHVMAVKADYTVTYLASGLYGANTTRIVPPNLSAFIITIISTATGVTQFTYTNAVVTAGNIWRNADIADMNFLGGDQNCDTGSCTDSGNNNTSPPTPGLVFAAIPISAPSGGYLEYNQGLGLGLGLALGSGYTYGRGSIVPAFTNLQNTSAVNIENTSAVDIQVE